jgi:hypothetical protein
MNSAFYLISYFAAGDSLRSSTPTSMIQLEAIGDDTVEEIRRKQEYYNKLIQSNDYFLGRLWADAWCAAFVWKKNNEFAYPITEEVFRNIEKYPYSIPIWMRDEIMRLREQYQFFHWHLAFSDVFRVLGKGEETENEQTGWSGGFDVVLGNPPWDQVEMKEKEWFATRFPEIAEAAGAERKRKIEVLATNNPELYRAFLDEKRLHDGRSHFVRNSARYPLCGRGRINTYAIFAENMGSVIGAKGLLGCIVPTGIATDDTTKFFFRHLMETHTLASLYSFENEEFIFPTVHHDTRFCLLTIAGKDKLQNAVDFVFFARQTSNLQNEDRHFSLSATDITLFNPNTQICPIFRSKRDMLITKTMYQCMPVLIKEGSNEENPWNITLRQGIFNMTSDSHLFRTREQLESDGWKLRENIFYGDGERYLPLYEGKMIWHFDHRFSTYDAPGKSVLDDRKLPELTPEQHRNPSLLSIPRYWVHESHFSSTFSEKQSNFLGFRDVTYAGVLRTAIVSIIPVVPCGNNLPLMFAKDKHEHNLMFLATNLSSFVFDYVARQKVGGTHMNFFILKQLPILPPATYQQLCPWSSTHTLGDWIAPRALELTYAAWDLEAFAQDCGYDGPPFRWDEERRFLLRCELDAAYFHLYDIARDDVDYIMDTFRIWREKEEKQYGEYRTKRVILEIYDEMRQAMDTGEPYRTMLQPPPADPSLAHPPRMEMKVWG